MSLFLVSILILLVALLFPLRFLFTRRPNDDSKLPPGKLGFIGETLAYFNANRRGVPEKFFQDRMRKFSSQIFKTLLFGEPTLVFCESTGNKFLFSNTNKLVQVKFPKSVETIFPFKPPVTNFEKSVLRRMLLAFVNPDGLQKYIGAMDSVCKKHFKNSWENKKDVMAVTLASSYTFSVACKVFLNIDDPIQVAKLQDPFEDLASGLWSFPINIPGTPFHKAIKASKLAKGDLAEIIKRRKMELAGNKASAGQDILSYMLSAGDDEIGEKVMDESEVASKLLGVLFAGHDTSSSVISIMIKYLAEFPRVYDQVHEEQMGILKSKAPGELLNWEDIQKMKYTWSVACEVLRLAPPSQGTFREAVTDFTYAGYSIPKGWKLYWSSSATHRNANYFPDPEKFDPSRFEGNGPAPYTFVPFGGGPRMCPGKEYVRLEICVFMHNLVTKFKWEKVIPDEKIIRSHKPRPAKGLPIRLQPHVC